jgi:hypothetical protein
MTNLSEGVKGLSRDELAKQRQKTSIGGKKPQLKANLPEAVKGQKTSTGGKNPKANLPEGVELG